MKYSFKRKGRFFEVVYKRKKYLLTPYFYKSLEKLFLENVSLGEIEKNLFSILKERVLYILSLRDRTEKEIKLYLKRLRLERFERKIIIFLKKLNFLNEKEFVKKFIEGGKNKRKGPYFIKKKLLEKGLDKNIVEEILNQSYTKDEERKIANILARRYLQKTKKPKIKDLAKLANFLKNRGFRLGVIYQIISFYEESNFKGEGFK